MGDCDRIKQIEMCATSGAHDIAGARDIARRFEQLENQVTVISARLVA